MRNASFVVRRSTQDARRTTYYARCKTHDGQHTHMAQPFSIPGTIDRSADQPLHAQLKGLIRRAIEDGRLRPGDRLPTEHELCRHFGLSRTPVRQALLELAQEGLLTRVPGRGTFVADVRATDRAAVTVTLRVVTEAGWADPLRQMALLWNREHPHRPLHLAVEELPYPRMRERLVDMVAAGTAPDIALLDSAWLAEFASMGYILSVDDIIPGWEEEHVPNLLPAAVAANRYRDRLVAVPANVDTTVLWYRRDWLEAEGLRPPRTWEDLITVGRHFQQAEVRARYGADVYGLLFVGGRRGGETTTYQLLPFLWAAGGDIIAAGHVVLNSPATVHFLNFLRDLITRHRVTPPEVTGFKWNQAALLFAQRRAVMAVGGLYEIGFMREARGWTEEDFLKRVGVAPLPAGPAGQYATLGGMSYAIFRQSDHPEVALRFLEYSAREEVVRLFWKQTQRHVAWLHVTPTRRIAPLLAASADLLAYGRPRPAIPEYTRVSEQFRWLVEEALRGHEDLERLVARAADRIAAITRLPV